MIVLGIESSCDETGAALISDTKGLLADALHTQIDMHRAYGGVVPELASRDHIRRVIALTDEVLYKANLKRSDISAIAVTEGPGLAGALLAGNAVAHAMGFGLGIPVIGVHHLEGPIPLRSFLSLHCLSLVDTPKSSRWPPSAAMNCSEKHWMMRPVKLSTKPRSCLIFLTPAVLPFPP